jgi:hypothetical protein
VSSRTEKCLNLMDIKVGKMLAKVDEDLSINFASLGSTRSPGDANSWLEKEMPYHPLG